MSTKTKIVSAVVLAVMVALVFAAVAQAGTSTSEAIIKDAKDNNRLDGNWTAAQVRAALAYLRANPTLQQYTDVEGILEGFLSSGSSPGVSAGGLRFTGGELVLLFGAGVGLMSSGALLRRRRS